MTPKDCPLVIIRWLDSAQPTSAWKHLAGLEMPKCIECATVGWLLRGDNEAKVVAQSVGGLNDEENAQTCGVMAIPTRAVLSVEHLEETHPETGVRLAALQSGEEIVIPRDREHAEKMLMIAEHWLKTNTSAPALP